MSPGIGRRSGEEWDTWSTFVAIGELVRGSGRILVGRRRLRPAAPVFLVLVGLLLLLGNNPPTGSPAGTPWQSGGLTFTSVGSSDAMPCGEHSYGQVQQYLRANPCRSLFRVMSRELPAYGGIKFTGYHYASRVDGTTVVIAEAEPQAGDVPAALLKQTAETALGFPRN